MSRIILHIDMDAFFAAIEERERPELRGRPIVVGADPKGGRGRGVVSTASYAARAFGITSAMPISKAWQLCPAPKCAYLPVDGKLYGIVSERIMAIVRWCVDSASIEQVSIDEAYADVSSCVSFERAETLARAIKEAIKKKERLTCSVGVGPNKLIAKIASDFQKPDGLTVVRPETAQNFLDHLPVRKLPGIGPKTEAHLAQQGIRTVRELRETVLLESELGKKARGIDEALVSEEHEVKSLGHEITFERDSRDQALLTKTLLALCDEVMEDVRKEGARFRTITVRVRFENFETHTSATTLPAVAADGTLLQREALKLLFPYFKGKRLIRLLGVRVSNLKHG